MTARLETLTLMAGFDLPVRAIRDQIASALDVIVQMARLRDGSRRVTNISEVVGIEDGVIALHEIFAFDYAAGIDTNGRFRGKLHPVGTPPRALDRLVEAGVNVPLALFAGEPAVGPRPPPRPRARR